VDRLDELKIDEGCCVAGGGDGGGGFCGMSTETSDASVSILDSSVSRSTNDSSALMSLPEATDAIAFKVSAFCMTLTVAATVFKKEFELLVSTRLSAARVKIEPEFALATDTVSMDEVETDAAALRAPLVCASSTALCASSVTVATFVRSSKGEDEERILRRRVNLLFVEAETTMVASDLKAAL